MIRESGSTTAKGFPAAVREGRRTRLAARLFARWPPKDAVTWHPPGHQSGARASECRRCSQAAHRGHRPKQGAQGRQARSCRARPGPEARGCRTVGAVIVRCGRPQVAIDCAPSQGERRPRRANAHPAPAGRVPMDRKTSNRRNRGSRAAGLRVPCGGPRSDRNGSPGQGSVQPSVPIRRGQCLEPRRDMMARWADHVDHLRDGANVLPFEAV